MDGLTTSKNKKKPFVDYSNKLTVELIVSQFTFFSNKIENILKLLLFNAKLT